MPYICAEMWNGKWTTTVGRWAWGGLSTLSLWVERGDRNIVANFTKSTDGYFGPLSD